MSPSSSNLIVFTAGSSGPGAICGQVFSVPTLSDEPRANTSVLRGHCDTSLPASWSSDSTSWRTPGPSGAQDRVCVPEAALSLEACPSSRGTVSEGQCQSPGAGRAAPLLPCVAHHPYPGPLPGSQPGPCPQLSAWQGLWGLSRGACGGVDMEPDGGGRLSRSQSSRVRVAVRSGDKWAAHPCRLGLTWKAPCFVTPHRLRP